MEFYKTEIGKIMNHGVHDAFGRLASMGVNIQIIKHSMENNSPDLDDIRLRLNRIENSGKQLSDAIDYMYDGIKALHKDGL